MDSCTPEEPSAYLEFKAAHSLFRRQPAALDAAQRAELRRVVERQRAIQRRVLAAPEARGVCVPEATLEAALAEIRGRYGSDAEYLADLAANRLTEALVVDALRRELAVDAVLGRVSAGAEPVTDTETELFYRLHPGRFARAERRRVRHILVTINDSFDENRRESALARIREIASRLAREPGRFAEQAAKHSECPSALQGGMLGEHARGQLFPALEAAAFALQAGGTSEVVESPLGFHVLRCEAILAAGSLPFAAAAPRIRAMLERNRAQASQREWLGRLMSSGAQEATASA